MWSRAIPVLVVAVASMSCGGGGGDGVSSSPAPSPTPVTTPSPTPSPSPTATGVTVYASSDNRVYTASTDLRASDTVVQGGIIGAGWTSNEYGTVGTGAAFKFDLPSQIAGRTITKATFRLQVSDAPREFPARPQLRVNAFASDWNPGALTWNIWTALGCHAAGEAQLPAPSASGPLDFDVTTIVQNWASGTSGNYGLRLMVNQPEPGMMGRMATTWFYSLEYNNALDDRPKLMIEFQ